MKDVEQNIPKNFCYKIKMFKRRIRVQWLRVFRAFSSVVRQMPGYN